MLSEESVGRYHIYHSTVARFRSGEIIYPRARRIFIVIIRGNSESIKHFRLVVGIENVNAKEIPNEFHYGEALTVEASADKSEGFSVYTADKAVIADEIALIGDGNVFAVSFTNDNVLCNGS